VAAGGDAPAVATRYRRAVERALGADVRFAARLQRILASPLGARAALRAVDLTAWTRRNFARWMYEDYPRALLLTPRRWHRHALAGPGAYRAAA
jgi:menaquinone-9 beta-reductase